ncbi:MAG: DUF1622 domain-containing protein [Candidatus Magasanikbacteria bacterium]|uniref:DUF1622 domain-containing protein n=1 Tax=Candidatus Magasanikbacteria bacterium CG10_big_fil_rev_8_21_14_0_10_38_6 TaxID=1974647 RepID=A0A2M6NZQ8_9BACT|nr:DUF1622 domain-containing protein [Candidatus Magasanikbacteria bacterium]NCS72151.1 DUF1622 domain-containing protein [Candidatus Magasanikbacteria bacterium]PIR76944.1 MAG: hypothetical protein COU30_05135 [Candidatus Magasanikbacteria bacterium CG10_big_fil_rev_8_21_14_0_10_38_6]
MPVFQLINNAIQIVGWIIEYIGLFIVVISVFFALTKVFLRKTSLESIRRFFAEKIIFGLEFIIAADILLATVTTDVSDITRLGGIVLIRVVLGYSLKQEVLNYKDCRTKIINKGKKIKK